MTGKKVSAAIVTYNRLDLLKESLGAVLGQTKYLNHVIVINNKSNDGTKEYLSSLIQKLSTQTAFREYQNDQLMRYLKRVILQCQQIYLL
ncbi:hypothetical protein BMS83_09665 [Leuconostoc pseudomesenteroides]|nr:hypothetical protein BMS83_09665 [Leuconostoc pseudomesenteroides]